MAKLKGCACGVIGIDANGNPSFNTQSMSWGYIRDGNSVIF
jgi:hypothetical protein